MARRELAERFLEKVDVRDLWSCWNWTGAKANGYGRFTVSTNECSRKAHRVSYWLNFGEWPEVCRHKCDNRACVNPLHLESGTQLDNVRDTVVRGRARNANMYKTECKRGHPLSGQNLYVYPDGSRLCRVCNLDSSRKSRERLRNVPQPWEG